jgi:CheY-like chemotaxis protein
MPNDVGPLAKQSGGAHARVLVVEDNRVNQRVAQGLLTRRGHDVTLAQNGSEALACLDRQTFDVVLMDLQMPTMDGFAATAAIREGERVSGKHVRIVAVTAHAMNSDRERCLNAGMDGYLAKPFDPEKLFMTVEQSTGRDSSPATITAAADPPTFDEAALLHRLSDNTELMIEVIGIFIEDCPTRLAAIEDAVTRRDAEDLRKAAHALKGAAANLSAIGLFEAASAMEQIGAQSRMDAAMDAWRHLSAEADAVLVIFRQLVPPSKEPSQCVS